MAEDKKLQGKVAVITGGTEGIASAAAFLANPESAFINGENLTVDGGWNA